MTSTSPGRLRRGFDKHWYAYAMVIPTVLVLGVLVLFPLVQGVYQSFTDLNEANQKSEICTKVLGGAETCKPNPNQAEFVGIDNYVNVLTGEVGHFWLQFVNTLVWTLACVTFHYGIGLGLAVMLNRRLKGRSLYRVLLIVPWAVPAFISAFAWRFLFDQRFGLINASLKAVGLDPVAWFDHRWTSLFTAIVTNIWLGVPFMMVAMLGGLQSIPSDLYEAAEMDGTTPWQRFRHVTLPGLRPVSSTVILLGTIWTFNMFPIIFFVTRGQPAGQTEILVTGAFRAAFEGIRNYSLAATYGVLILSMLDRVRHRLQADPQVARERCSDGVARLRDRSPSTPRALPRQAPPATSPGPGGPQPRRVDRAARHARLRDVHRAVPGRLGAAELVQAGVRDPQQRDHACSRTRRSRTTSTSCSRRASRTGSSTRWSSPPSRWSSASRCPPVRATR